MPKTTETASALRQGTAGKYLTFHLGQESYGVPVLKIREIIRVVDITAVPQMPSHVKGVINLRGKIIPVVDLRLKFGMPEAAAGEHTCIVVVQVRGGGGTEIQLGLVVDNVEEVAQIGEGEIEPTPEFGSEVATENLLGMAKLKNRVVILLDLDRALTGEMAATAGLA